MLAMAERIEPDGGTAARGVDDGVVTLQRDGCRACCRPGSASSRWTRAPNRTSGRRPSLLDRMAFHLDLTEVSLRTTSLSDEAGDRSRLRRRRARRRSDISRIARLRTAADERSFCHAALALASIPPARRCFALRAARVAPPLSGRDAGRPTPTSASPPAWSSPPRHPPSAAGRAAGRRIGTRTAADRPEDRRGRHGRGADPPTSRWRTSCWRPPRPPCPPTCWPSLRCGDGGRGLARAPAAPARSRPRCKRGRPIGTRQGEPRNGARLHLLETLKAAAPWQTLRRRSPIRTGSRSGATISASSAFASASAPRRYSRSMPPGPPRMHRLARGQGRGRTAAGRLLCPARPGGADRVPRQGRDAAAAADRIAAAGQAQPGRRCRAAARRRLPPGSRRRWRWPKPSAAAAARR